MGKNKLKKFKEIAEFPNVYELTDFSNTNDNKGKPAGKWNEHYFQADRPITLELACGKGEYTLALARKYPDRNIIGIDIKGNRIWKGAQKALEENLNNVRFLRIYIDHIDQYFGPGEVDNIWITFPDPFLRYSKRLKRLTSPKFLELYKYIMRPDGHIHLKTDSQPLMTYTKKVIEALDCPLYSINEDIYSSDCVDDILQIKTYYERKHLKSGKSIKYIAFGLPEKLVKYPKKIG